MEGSAAEGNFGLLNIYNPMDVFMRPVLSNEFFFSQRLQSLSYCNAPRWLL